MVAERKVSLLVDPANGGQRVERLVAQLLGASRNEARELCASGAVRLDGRRVNKGARAPIGATLEVLVSHEDRIPADPTLPLDVRLERSDLVVVDKPAGMPSVPLRHGEGGSLASSLIARYPEMLGLGHHAREPGLVHRLDTQTSGLLVAARNAETFAELTAALRSGSLSKRYLAVCSSANLDDSGEIDLPLCPDPTRYGRVVVAPPGTPYRRECHTRYRVVERGDRFALLELEASPAFRHQIRAHLAAIDHPIAGDRLYGGAQLPALGERHALHASHIAWAGDRTRAFSVDADAPLVFRELLRSGGDS